MFNKPPFDVSSEKCISSLAVVEQKLLEGKKGEEIFIIEDESCETDDTLLQGSSNQDVTLTQISETNEYALNTKVLCCSSDGLYYVAKIIRIEQLPSSSTSPSSLSLSSAFRNKVYTIHYQGWNSRYDEEVPEAIARYRFLPLNERNLEEANKKIKEARRQQKMKKPVSMRQVVVNKHLDLSNDMKELQKRSRKKDVAIEPKKGRNTQKQQSSVIKNDYNWKLKIKLPVQFQDLLVTDMEKIVNGKYLNKLPARYTVDDILEQYIIFGGASDTNNIAVSDKSAHLCVQGLKNYFNSTLESRLLYACERKQFEHLRRRHLTRRKRRATDLPISNEHSTAVRWQPSNTYGFGHLIRLLYKITEFFEVAEWTSCDEGINSLVANSIELFIRYLEINYAIFFDVQKDYVLTNNDH